MKTILYILSVTMLMACSGSSKKQTQTAGLNLGPETFKLTSSEIEEIQEMSNVKAIDGVEYRLTYIKPDIIRKIYGEESKEYDNFSCFYMDITTDAVSDIQDYPSQKFASLNERVNFLSFLIKDYLFIKGGSQTYHCLNSTFDRNFGKSHVARFFLVFNKIPEKELTFNFYDDYFNNGEIKLKLKI